MSGIISLLRLMLVFHMLCFYYWALLHLFYIYISSVNSCFKNISHHLYDDNNQLCIKPENAKIAIPGLQSWMVFSSS